MIVKSPLRKSLATSAVKLVIFLVNVRLQPRVQVTTDPQEVLSATSVGRWGTLPVTALVQPQVKATEEEEIILVVTLVAGVLVRLATLAVDSVICPETAPRDRSAITVVKLVT